MRLPYLHTAGNALPPDLRGEGIRFNQYAKIVVLGCELAQAGLVFVSADLFAGEDECFANTRVLPVPFVADEKRSANEEESSKEQSHNQ